MIERLDEEKVRAIRRWKLGHHTFHLYLVAMNGVLEHAGDALRERRWDDLAKLLGELRSFYNAATAAMKYASSYRKSTYANLIRPSMSEPMVSPGFSGQLNQEHEIMLGLLKSLKAELGRARRQENVPERVDKAWRGVMSAQSKNRREHVWICEKFVEGGRSLLAEHFAGKKTEKGEDQW